jgi:minor extracellular serine protease Vpr
MFPVRKTGIALARAIPFVFCVAPLFAQLAPNRYTLLLEDPPVASRFARREDLQSAAAAAYRSRIEARQRDVKNELARRQIQVTGSTSTLINAIYVIAPASRVSEMTSIPGVVAVRPMRRFKPNLNAATQLMNAPAAWNLVGGQSNAGAGMKIAVLDTGIDQTHPAFQDPTLQMPNGFPICDAYNQPLCSSYTNNKVIVARSYVQQLAGFNDGQPPNPATSTPDDYTPRDRMGHGTGVASAAAGNQNTSPAVAAAGGGLAFSGMAPKAWLGNYKIGGTPGVNDFPSDDVLIQAISDALTDGFDVATLSEGSLATTGALDTGATCGMPAGAQCDPVAAAFEAAAQKGLVITVAVGNGGSNAPNYPYFNSISSPASAPSVIGVGATINSHALTPSVSVNAPGAPSNLTGIAAQLSDALFLNAACSNNCSPIVGALTAQLIDVTTVGDDGYACSALPNTPALFGAIVLIARGNCPFATKAANALNVGAFGIILYNNSNPLVEPQGMCGFFGPAVMISNSDGLNLKNYVDANSGAMVTIDTAGIETPLGAYDAQAEASLAQNQLASFSSFGPTPDGMIKPDLVATGALDSVPFCGFTETNYGVYLAAQSFDPNGELYSSTGYAAADGTSFATPLMAGAAALVKQAHPDYTVAQIKSALVNFSAQDTTTDDLGDSVTPQWLGAGRLDAGAAANATVAVAPTTLSFGYLQTNTSLPITKPLAVTNQGPATVTLAVSVLASGAGVTVDQTNLTIPAGGSATLNVTTPNSLPSPASYTGQIVMQASGTTLHVPYMFLVGTGVVNNAIAYIGNSAFGLEGVTGQDTGPSFVQVVDPYGVPVAGTPVTFSAFSGSMIFNSVPGEPACAGSGTNSVVCNTDNYGFAYADTVLGSTSGSPAITVGPRGLTQVAGTLILPQPAITQGQITDGASGQPAISAGSVVAIQGVNLMNTNELGDNTGEGFDVPLTAFYPLVLDGVTVSFDVPGANISLPAPIVAAGPNEIDVQAPWELAGQGSAQVKIIIDELIFSNVATATIAAYTPAFFTSSGNVAYALDTNNNVISTSNPAIRGNTITFAANGLGPLTNTPPDGYGPTGNTSTTQACTVSLGGQPATVQFCGMPQGIPEFEVAVQVPTSLSPGNQSVSLTIAGQTSPSGLMIPVQ